MKRKPGPAPARKADQVAKALMREVLTGRYPKGSLLPVEAALAKKHRVTRVVIREAVKLLEVHRLLKPRRRVGTEVLDPLRSTTAEVAATLIEPRPGHYDRRMLSAYLELRAEVEVLVAGWAAERCTPGAAHGIREALDAMRAALPDAAAYQAAYEALTERIAQAADNPFAVMLTHWGFFIDAALEPLIGPTRPAVEAHWDALAALVELVCSKDVAGAKAQVRAFHDWAVPQVLEAASTPAGGII